MIQVPQNITIQQQPKDKDALALDLCGAEIIKDDDGEEKCAEFPPRIWLQHYRIDGKEYNAPSGYHHILTEIYGDYMKLPPRKERIPVHITDGKGME